MTQERGSWRASASIEMRKKKQFPFWELSAQMRKVFRKVLTYRMPAVLAKGGLMKISGESSFQPAKKSHKYYTRISKNYKFAGIIKGNFRALNGAVGTQE